MQFTNAGAIAAPGLRWTAMRLSLARAAAAFGFAGIALLVAWIATPLGAPAARAAVTAAGSALTVSGVDGDMVNTARARLSGP